MKKLTKEKARKITLKYFNAKEGSFGAGVRERVRKMRRKKSRKIYVNTARTFPRKSGLTVHVPARPGLDTKKLLKVSEEITRRTRARCAGTDCAW